MVEFTTKKSTRLTVFAASVHGLFRPTCSHNHKLLAADSGDRKWALESDIRTRFLGLARRPNDLRLDFRLDLKDLRLDLGHY